jgi:hypothetical protein
MKQMWPCRSLVGNVSQKAALAGACDIDRDIAASQVAPWGETFSQAIRQTEFEYLGAAS